MPIEIRELQIKAVIAAEPRNENNTVLNAAAIEKIKKEVLKECMLEMKNLLREQKER